MGAKEKMAADAKTDIQNPVDRAAFGFTRQMAVMAPPKELDGL